MSGYDFRKGQPWFVGDYSGVTANSHLSFNLGHSMKVSPATLEGKVQQ
jgi:hypothetical protein